VLSSTQFASLPKIVQVIGDGAPGGGTTMLLGLVDDLCKLGHQNLAVVAPPQSYLEEEVRRRRIEFIGFDFSGSAFDLTRPFRLRSVIRGWEDVVVHAHGLRAAYTWQQACGKRHPLTVYTLHGFHHLSWPFWMRVWADRAERRVMREALHTVFVSLADQRIARDRGLSVGQSQHIPNGICLTDIPPLGESHEKRWDVIFIGRMVRPKDPLLAATVLNRLALLGYRVAMAGEGELQESVRERLSQNGASVTWLGQQTRDQVLHHLQSTRCVLMTSRSEGFPILPLEAMALGVPIVMTPFASAPELVGAAPPCGVGVPSFQVDDIQSAVEDLLADQVKQETLRRLALHRVKAEFNRESLSSRYLRLYEMNRM